MMANMDAVALNNETLERKLAKEKQKTVRYVASCLLALVYSPLADIITKPCGPRDATSS